MSMRPSTPVDSFAQCQMPARVADLGSGSLARFRGRPRDFSGKNAPPNAWDCCQDTSVSILRRRERLHCRHPPTKRRSAMLLAREIMYCKPGKVRPMVEKFVAMSKLMERSGQPPRRGMSDVVADRYWTLVAEFEVESLDDFEKMMRGEGEPMDEDAQKEMEELMKGYHDLVDVGRREIYRLEN